MSTERVSDDFHTVILIILAAIVLFPLLMMLFAVPMMGMMGWWSGGTPGIFSPIWRIGMMLVWIVVLIGISYLLYRGLVSGIGSSMTADPALEELRVAYARGDLSDEEFEERREKLRHEREPQS